MRPLVLLSAMVLPLSCNSCTPLTRIIQMPARVIRTAIGPALVEVSETGNPATRGFTQTSELALRESITKER